MDTHSPTEDLAQNTWRAPSSPDAAMGRNPRRPLQGLPNPPERMVAPTLESPPIQRRRRQGAFPLLPATMKGGTRLPLRGTPPSTG